MIDLNALLTPAELAAYRRHIAGGTFEDGSSEQAKAAQEAVSAMLALLVTSGGRHADETTGTGRGSIVTELIDALVGPDPDPQAWIEAIAVGTFDLTGYKAYAKRPEPVQGKLTKIGTPGNYLPRLLQRYEKAVGNRRPNSKEIADLRTALGILIATTLLKELRNATNARAALGSAWPLVAAVSGRPHAELRRLLAAHGDDRKFCTQLREDIKHSVEAWEKRHSCNPKPTNKAVDTQAPEANIVRHFAAETEIDKRRTQAFIEFGTTLLSGQAHPDDATMNRAIEAFANDPAISWLKEHPHGRGAQVYLDDTRIMQPDDRPAFCAMLQALMPVAAGPSTPEQIIGRAAMASIGFPRPLVMTESSRINERLGDLAQSIQEHVGYVGLPPVGTPIAHLTLFEASACFWSMEDNWPARDDWEFAGLCPGPPSEQGRKAAARLWEWLNRQTNLANFKAMPDTDLSE